MRRAAPIFIIVIAVLAIVIDFVALPMPSNDGTTRRLETKLGLDLRGGLRIEYQVLPAEGKAPTRDDLNVMRQIIVNRIDKSGVAEPQVVVQGNDRIIVEMPGVQNPDQIRDLVGTTGRLDFVPLGQTQMVQDQEVGGEVLDDEVRRDRRPRCASCSRATRSPPRRSAPTRPASGRSTSRSPVRARTGSPSTRRTTSATTSRSSSTARSSPRRSSTARSPTARSRSQSGGIGGYPLEDAQNLVTILQFGQLPFPIAELANTTVSPTLGEAFLQQSVLAGLIAILMVVFFMVVHYRMPGVVASIALVIYALIVYALFRLIPVTLTLAGVAGFVLSVGMAVDANILIFERMKEELRVGKSLPAAIEAGFNRAWNSILDSNVSSLITAMILFLFGTSTIRGFGLVLIVGVLVSMFTAVVVTRTILRVVVAQPWARKASLYGVTEDEFLARPAGRPVRGEARSRV